MIHQRLVKWVMRIVAFVIVLLVVPYIPLIGRRQNLAVIVFVYVIVWIPIEILIGKMFPPPDWYAHEDENAKVTSLNLTQAKPSEDKTRP